MSLRRPRSWLRGRRQHRTLKLRRTPVERVQRIGSGSPCRVRYHPIGKLRTPTAIRVGGAHEVASRLEAKFLRCNEFPEHRGNLVTGKPVGSIQNPCKLHGNLAAYETGTFRYELRQQYTGRFRLPRVVTHQVSRQNVGIERNHRSLAPSAIARSMSTSVTGKPSCLSRPLAVSPLVQARSSTVRRRGSVRPSMRATIRRHPSRSPASPPSRRLGAYRAPPRSPAFRRCAA